jgi:preprotein translocase subunit SecD
MACSSGSDKSEKRKPHVPGTGARLVFAIEFPKNAALSREEILDQALTIVRERVQHMQVKDPAVYKKDDRIVLEFVDADLDKVERAQRVVLSGAKLRFRLAVHDHPGMRKLCRAIERDGDADAHTVSAVRDAWTNAQTGATAADCYLRAAERDLLAKHVDKHRDDLALETTQEVVYEEQPAIPGESPPGWRTHVVNRTSVLTGAHVANARVTFNPEINLPEVWLEFNEDGKRLFALITAHNIGKKLLMSLDDRVLSAPVIHDKVTGGVSVISLGRSDAQQMQREATDLVAAIRAGSLPAPLRLESATSF